MRTIDASTIADAVRSGYIPALLAALTQATGDLSLLRDDLRPDPTRITEPHGGLSAEQRTAGRELAVDAIVRLSEAGHRQPLSELTSLRPLFDHFTGTAVTDDTAALLLEELGTGDADPRAPRWSRHDLAPSRPFRVLIVGAGMSGLLVAHRLKQAGIDVVVVDKNTGVGGTWFENRYPGCRVDVPNHLYSYSFEQRDWERRFSPQAELLDYFRQCADELGVAGDIRLGTEVRSATFRDEPRDWAVVTNTGTLYADAVVSAVGQLNRPRLPDIEGRETFAGRAFHSARWDGTVDLTGRRVAVIGTGASAIQIIPAIAEGVAELHVYQRTPPWLMPTPDYHADVSAGMRWLLHHVPNYRAWYRLSLFWRLAEGMLPAAGVDPTWVGDGRSVSARNDQLRRLLTTYLEAQFATAPELLPHVRPQYPPLAKRILLDNGVWAATLTRDNVELVPQTIDRITPTGVVAGGRERHADVIVYATGFQASRFLTPMRVMGRQGVDLHTHWGDDARAYLGVTVPGFPNLFCMYGPNTNLVANGSIICFSECEASYIVDCVRLLLEQGAAAMDCRPDVHDEYNRLVDDGNARMAWGAANVNSWYRNPAGRITQNWPFSLEEFWRRTRHADPADFEFL